MKKFAKQTATFNYVVNRVVTKKRDTEKEGLVSPSFPLLYHQGNPAHSCKQALQVASFWEEKERREFGPLDGAVSRLAASWLSCCLSYQPIAFVGKNSRQNLKTKKDRPLWTLAFLPE